MDAHETPSYGAVAWNELSHNGPAQCPTKYSIDPIKTLHLPVVDINNGHHFIGNQECRELIWRFVGLLLANSESFKQDPEFERVVTKNFITSLLRRYADVFDGLQLHMGLLMRGIECPAFDIYNLVFEEQNRLWKFGSADSRVHCFHGSSLCNSSLADIKDQPGNTMAVEVDERHISSQGELPAVHIFFDIQPTAVYRLHSGTIVRAVVYSDVTINRSSAPVSSNLERDWKSVVLDRYGLWLAKWADPKHFCSSAAQTVYLSLKPDMSSVMVNRYVHMKACFTAGNIIMF
jgi:hypothetical protein